MEVIMFQFKLTHRTLIKLLSISFAIVVIALLGGCVKSLDNASKASVKTTQDGVINGVINKSVAESQEAQIEAKIQNVTVQDLANASGDYLILDVREQWEYDQGHVPGVTLIPMGQLEQRISELPDDKALYVICHSGVRSAKASDMLLQAGKKDIRNVLGGTVAWAQAGLPIER